MTAPDDTAHGGQPGRTYYFVGGPTEGHGDAFFRRLAEIGGSPQGWKIYPHASGDGRALHVVEVVDEDAILTHLAQFAPFYERGPIVEIATQTQSPQAEEAPAVIAGRAREGAT
jgi:hypothetical protein